MPGKNVTQQTAATPDSVEINKTLKEVVSLIKAILANTEFWKNHSKGVSGRVPQGVKEMQGVKHANFDSHEKNLEFLKKCIEILDKKGLDPKTSYVTDAFYGYIKEVRGILQGDQNKQLDGLADQKRYLLGFVRSMNLEVSGVKSKHTPQSHGPY